MSKNLDREFCQAVLSFDEMDVRKIVELEPKSQTILGPCKNLQMLIMRGLCHK